MRVGNGIKLEGCWTSCNVGVPNETEETKLEWPGSTPSIVKPSKQVHI